MNFDPILIWFLIGLALVMSEFMLPGVILVFFGAGCWVTALTTWLGLTGSWTSQLLVFALSSVVMLLLLRRWFRARLSGYLGADHDPEANLDDLAGQAVTVTTAIAPGSDAGRVLYKGAEWSARSTTDIPAGSRAVITAADGITLVVRPEQ
jgi:membrane protein implicated in regulation of membrane protease activity